MTDAPAADKKPHTLIVGGGIGGCTAAIALAQAGARVSIYEAAPKLLEIGAGINVQAVAIGVLNSIGISEEMLLDPVLGDGITTSKIEYYTNEGVFIADEAVGRNKGDRYPQFSSHRAKFHNALIAKAREVVGEENVHLDHSFLGMDRHEDGTTTVHFEKLSVKGEKQPSVTCDFLIGCDGLKSPVRATLLGDGLPKYTGRTIYRGLCEVDALIGDGYTVTLCGNGDCAFICYPISDGMRKEGKTHCNWGLTTRRPEPGGIESWTSLAKIEDIRDELARMDIKLGGVTPLQIAEKTERILGWALFDRDPLASFDFGTVTLLGDAAHPLLPYGSQGASQAIMDGEALGMAYKLAMAAGEGIRGVVKRYSDFRCEVSGKVVVANRNQGSTAVLRMVDEKCGEMTKEGREAWIKENGRNMFNEVIQEYRASMPKSVSIADSAQADSDAKRARCQ